MEIATVIIVILIFGLSILNVVLTKVRASRTTYEQLLKRSRELIRQGKFDRLQKYLQAHPRLVLLHYNELISELSELTAVESEEVKK